MHHLKNAVNTLILIYMYDMIGDARTHGFSMGNNPMVGATVACAVAVEEAMKG